MDKGQQAPTQTLTSSELIHCAFGDFLADQVERIAREHGPGEAFRTALTRLLFEVAFNTGHLVGYTSIDRSVVRQQFLRVFDAGVEVGHTAHAERHPTSAH